MPDLELDPIEQLVRERELEIEQGIDIINPKRKKTPPKQTLADIATRRATEGLIGGAVGGGALYGLGKFIPFLASATPQSLLASIGLGALLGLGGSAIGTAAEALSGKEIVGDVAEIGAGLVSPQFAKAVTKFAAPQAFAPIAKIESEVVDELMKKGARDVTDSVNIGRFLRDLTSASDSKLVFDILRGAEEIPTGMKVLLSELPAEQKIAELAAKEPGVLREIARAVAATQDKKVSDFLAEASNKAVISKIDELLNEISQEGEKRIFSQKIQPLIETLKPDFYKNISQRIEAAKEAFKDQGFEEGFKALEQFKKTKRKKFDFVETLYEEQVKFRDAVEKAKDLSQVPPIIDSYLAKIAKIKDDLNQLKLPEELKQELLQNTEDLKNRVVLWRAISKIGKYFHLTPQEMMQSIEDPSFISKGVGGLARKIVDIKSIPQKEQSLVDAFKTLAESEEFADVKTLADFFGEDFGTELVRRALESAKLLAERGAETAYVRRLGTPVISIVDFLEKQNLLDKLTPEQKEKLIQEAKILDTLGLNFGNILKEGVMPAERQVSQTAGFLTNFLPLNQAPAGRGMWNIFLRSQDEINEQARKEALEKALFAYRILAEPDYAKQLSDEVFRMQLAISPEGFLERGIAKQIMPSIGQALSAAGTDIGKAIITKESKEGRGRVSPQQKEEQKGTEQINLKALNELKNLLETESDLFDALDKFSGKQTSAITDELLDLLEKVESGGNPNAVSRKGALGAYQFMPKTAAWLGINPLDKKQAREGARKYLEMHLENFGSLPLALAAYNFGQGNLRKLIEKQKTNDWKALYRFLPGETKRFLAAFGYKPEA